MRNFPAFENVMDHLDAWAGYVVVTEQDMPNNVPVRERTTSQKIRHRNGMRHIQSSLQLLSLYCNQLEEILINHENPQALVARLQEFKRRKKLVTLNGTDPLSRLIAKYDRQPVYVSGTMAASAQA